MVGHPGADRPQAVPSPRIAALAAAVAAAVAAVSACTEASPRQGSPTAASVTLSASTPGATGLPPTTAPTTSAATVSATAPTSPVGPSSRGTESSIPPTPTGGPTYFTPDPTSYALSGPVVVDAARQDPFSNLLQRGALHEHPVVLDVTATPDEAWVPGTPTLLFGTCRCPQRGSGLRLTVEGASAIRDVAGGAVGILGTFLPVVTASDAVTLRPAG